MQYWSKGKICGKIGEGLGMEKEECCWQACGRWAKEFGIMTFRLQVTEFPSQHGLEVIAQSHLKLMSPILAFKMIYWLPSCAHCHSWRDIRHMKIREPDSFFHQFISSKHTAIVNAVFQQAIQVLYILLGKYGWTSTAGMKPVLEGADRTIDNGKVMIHIYWYKSGVWEKSWPLEMGTKPKTNL